MRPILIEKMKILEKIRKEKIQFLLQVMRPILLEKKKWKPEIKDSWMTFFSSIVKVSKKKLTFLFTITMHCQGFQQKSDFFLCLSCIIQL